MGKNREYALGVVITILSAASLADHICYGVDTFPISAVILGIGIFITARSYRK